MSIIRNHTQSVYIKIQSYMSHTVLKLKSFQVFNINTKLLPHYKKELKSIKMSLMQDKSFLNKISKATLRFFPLDYCKMLILILIRSSQHKRIPTTLKRLNLSPFPGILAFEFYGISTKRRLFFSTKVANVFRGSKS